MRLWRRKPKEDLVLIESFHVCSDSAYVWVEERDPKDRRRVLRSMIFVPARARWVGEALLRHAARLEGNVDPVQT